VAISSPGVGGRAGALPLLRATAIRGLNVLLTKDRTLRKARGRAKRSVDAIQERHRKGAFGPAGYS
jgi:hypothetical protein